MTLSSASGRRRAASHPLSWPGRWSWLHSDRNLFLRFNGATTFQPWKWHEKKSVAPPNLDESPKKEKLPPDLVERVRQYYGKGKRGGGHSRSETAREFGISEGQVDRMIRDRLK